MPCSACSNLTQVSSCAPAPALPSTGCETMNSDAGACEHAAWYSVMRGPNLPPWMVCEACRLSVGRKEWEACYFGGFRRG